MMMMMMMMWFWLWGVEGVKETKPERNNMKNTDMPDRANDPA